MQTEIRPTAIPAPRPVQVPRHPRHVTRASLFAFDCHLCPNRQVAGAGLGGAAGSGLDHRGASDPGGTARQAGETAAGADGMAVTGEISLAVAAEASGENFPLALRILPRSGRAHLTAL